ncbi:oxidoreductase [Pseudomonas sp. GM48]|uniref:oxidoreductase n=1 Tax=Pseudomonas sp. GM48 TaxID=1144330 RepID=UPI0002701FF7|nr:NADH:flavin oxidoreductase [Pseudomonas sp. GM48]EJM62073.1 NADH:flavin oxidoreductase [Pseudomonas sp. GM48]
MNQNTDTLLSPLTMKGRNLRNRLVVAPMTRISATEDGAATDIMARYYERFARGGFGLVITEGIYTDQTYSQGYPYQPGMSDEAQAKSWRSVVERLHAHGSKTIAQIMHSGALSQGNRFREGTAAPSAVQPIGEQLGIYYGQGPYPLPRALTDEQIVDVIAGFAQAAKRAVATAGFDGIELHAANGYLLDQFLSAPSNLRDDRWGGDVRQRMTLIREAIHAVRDAIGKDSLLGVRVSQGKVNDHSARWPGGLADAEGVFGTLADSGVDFIHTTDYKAWQPAFSEATESLASAARRFAPGVAIIANGDLHQFDRARQLLADSADLVAIGKAALANPDLPQRLANGQPLNEFSSEMLTPIANIKEAEVLGN